MASRPMHGLTLLLIAGALMAPVSHGADAPSELGAPAHRFLFVVETSSGMTRQQRDVAGDAVHKLLLGGLNGRARPGDAIGVWTFGGRLETNGLPTQVWIPQQALDIANRVFRFLRDQSPGKKPDLGAVLRAVEATGRSSGTLTVFLVTSGLEPLAGTPFDPAINKVFREHGEGMRKAGRPFVTVFVVQEGKMVAHAITPGGHSIYIPPGPKQAASPELGKPPVTPGAAVPKPTEAPSAPIATNRAPPETAAQLPQPVLADEASPQPAAVRPPEPAPGPEVAGAGTGAAPASRPDAAALAESPPAVPSRLSEAVTRPEPVVTTTVSTPPAPAPVLTLPAESPAVVPKPAEPVPPAAVETPRPEPAVSLSPAPSGERPREGETRSSAVAAVPERSAAPTDASPRPARSSHLAVTHPAVASPTRDLLAGGALLLAAVSLTWILVRNLRRRQSPSIISQSMDQRKG